MATTALTADTFEKTVLDHEIVVVDFWADWCGPCKRFAPVFEGASEDGVNEGIFFGKVDTEAEQALAAAANITSIPMLMAFKDGILECNLEGVDAVKVLPEADGLCVLLMPAHAAADLSDALTHELSRIATWDPDQS